MNKLEQAARQALDALAESHDNVIDCFNVATNNGATRLQEIYKDQLNKHEKAVTALREALAHSGEANETGFEKVKLNPEYDLGIGRGSMTINRWVDDGKLGITGVKHDWDKIFTPKEQRTVAEQALQKLSDFQQSIEEPTCNQHPDAPHGFDRNASHCAGRYVCECEGWEPEPAEQEHDGHWSDCSTHNEPAYPNGECDCGGYPAEQEPVAWMFVNDDGECEEIGYGKDYLKGSEMMADFQPLYAAPVRTKDLMPDELFSIANKVGFDGELMKTNHDRGVPSIAEQYARAVIAADREKNRG